MATHALATRTSIAEEKTLSLLRQMSQRSFPATQISKHTYELLSQFTQFLTSYAKFLEQMPIDTIEFTQSSQKFLDHLELYFMLCDTVITLR